MKAHKLLILILCGVTWLSLGSGNSDGSSEGTPAVYLSLGQTNITTNNTEILITDIGDGGSNGGLPSLTCHTDLVSCCSNKETDKLGRLGVWHFPNGTEIKYGMELEIYRSRGPQVVNLHHHSETLGPTGSYCCTIPTNKGNNVTFCANIVVCLSLPELTNGMISYSDPTLDLNTEATHSCDPGYTLNGTNMVRSCASNGVWNGSAPTCQVSNITCTNLPDLGNGTINYNAGTNESRPVNTMAVHSCDPRYTLSVDSVRSCDSNGMWNGSAPTCQASTVVCSDLPNLTNGVINYNAGTFRQVNTEAAHSCDPGYTLTGDSVRRCDANGEWSGSTPTCEVTAVSATTSISSVSNETEPPTTIMRNNLPSNTPPSYTAGIGVLAVLWVATTIGWIVSCVVLIRQRQTQDKITATSTSDNPSYPQHNLSEQVYDEARVPADGGEYSKLDRGQGAAGYINDDTPTYDHADHSQLRGNQSQDTPIAVREEVGTDDEFYNAEEHTYAAVDKKKDRRKQVDKRESTDWV